MVPNVCSSEDIREGKFVSGRYRLFVSVGAFEEKSSPLLLWHDGPHCLLSVQGREGKYVPLDVEDVDLGICS